MQTNTQQSLHNAWQDPLNTLVTGKTWIENVPQQAATKPHKQHQSHRLWTVSIV